MIHDLQQIHVPVILKSPLPPRQKKQIQAQMGTAKPQTNPAEHQRACQDTQVDAHHIAPLGFAQFLSRRGGAISPPPPGLRAMGPWGLEETGG